MDSTDRSILHALQGDATISYADLGSVVGMSAASVHERVRKLRERDVIRRTTIDIDPSALGLDVLAYVSLSSDVWVGDEATHELLAAIPEVEAAYVVAGDSSLLVKVRASTNARLQQVLRRLHSLEGVSGTRSTIVLDTFFERSISIQDE